MRTITNTIRTMHSPRIQILVSLGWNETVRATPTHSHVLTILPLILNWRKKLNIPPDSSPTTLDMKGRAEHQQPVKMSSQVSLVPNRPQVPETTGTQLDYEEIQVESGIQVCPWWLIRWKRVVMDDSRATQWRVFGLGYLLDIWLFLLVFSSTTLPRYLYLESESSPRSRRTSSGSMSCLPNDLFNARSSGI